MDVAMSEPVTQAVPIPSERSLLIVEDDHSFLQRLAKALEQRGFSVTTAESVADGLLQVETAAPAFAIVDMRLGDGNGLDVISALKRRRPDARVSRHVSLLGLEPGLEFRDRRRKPLFQVLVDGPLRAQFLEGPAEILRPRLGLRPLQLPHQILGLAREVALAHVGQALRLRPSGVRHRSAPRVSPPRREQPLLAGAQGIEGTHRVVALVRGEPARLVE